ncbi:ribonuclease BN [Ancylobacter novellus DSM 506]|uniref:Ribonuclease BN n=1 Tax=Ancylobacter novellus (strain ATCC 8093 / DSM 506 / JCM 20403 / CCM 1077 / IAM 12100 / NBRC 12443 / NCIMB 10456) TaxID=639283 RepID=D7A8T0_ANCN5|nr:ribonuclease BN [Ancylobacter novellus DSM 506]
MAAADTRDKRAIWSAALCGAAIGAYASSAFRPALRQDSEAGVAGDGAHDPVDHRLGGITALDPGRGRVAEAPTQIPYRGWRDILIRTFNEFFADRVLSLSAGVTFYTLLAIFPALAAFISLYGLFLDPASIQSQLEAASWFLPAGAVEVMRDQIARLLANGPSSLGLRSFFSLALALWSANAGTKAVIEALNIAYEEEERRSFVRLTLTTLGFTLAAILFAVVALAAVVALPLVLKVLYLPSGTEWLISLLRWPALAVVVAFVITVVYRFGPCRQRPQWRWVSMGSAVAAVLWLATSVGFSWYVSRFASYEQTYGSLGAVVGFMVWIWLSVTVVLLGAELNAEIEHQTALDTTTGPPLPMGARGAEMADTLGATQ